VRDGVPRPRPVWAPVPLNELVMLIGLVLLAVGIARGRDAGAEMVGGGCLLLTLSVAEMSLREHLAGFRSHVLLLAFLPVLTVHAAVYFLVSDRWRGPVALAVDAVAFAALAVPLRQIFVGAHARARASR
jgi:uncharacterized membrane protein